MHQGHTHDKFERTLHESPLFTAPALTVDEYADQIETTVVEALNKFAPLRQRRRRPAKPNSRWLSQDAMDAKRQRRRLERVWKRSGAESDRLAYRKSCRRANKVINMSRRDLCSSS